MSGEPFRFTIVLYRHRRYQLIESSMPFKEIDDEVFPDHQKNQKGTVRMDNVFVWHIFQMSSIFLISMQFGDVSPYCGGGGGGSSWVVAGDLNLFQVYSMPPPKSPPYLIVNLHGMGPLFCR